MQIKRYKTLALLFGLGIFASSSNAATLTGIDVGTPSNPGEVKTSTDANGKTVYEVTGGGADIWGTSDNFYYAYQKVTGDFDYVVKVASHIGNSGDGGWSKAELMARLDDGSGTPQGGDPHLSNMATRPSADTANSAPAGVNYRGPQWRANRDGNSSWTTPNPGYPPNAANNWLRMERIGSVFYMYTSDDGKTWNMYNPYSPQGWDTAGSNPPGTDSAGESVFTQAWPTTIMLGLAVTAHNDAGVAVVKFTDYGPYTPVPITITAQPKAKVEVMASAPLELSVVAAGDPIHYQWRKNGQDIKGAVGSSYKVPVAATADAGSYTVKLYGGGKEVISAESVVTVTVDTVPPTIAKVSGSAAMNQVIVSFSEPVDTVSGQVVGNYSLNPSLSITKATVVNVTNVILTTAAQTPGTKYTFTVNNVKDLGGNVIKAATTKDFYSFVFATGSVTYERWDNANGDPGDITAFSTAVTAGTIRNPDVVTPVTQFGGPWGATDNYSSKISGWFIPPTSGNYVFFVSSDDQSNLYLSTDDTAANKKLIAQEGGWSNQYQWTSPGSGDATTKRSDQFGNTEWPYGNQITLQAGKKYYMEILQDEGGGGDGSDVTFIKEGAADPTQDAAGMAMKGTVIGSYMSPDPILSALVPARDEVGAAPNLISASFMTGLAKFDATTVSMKVDGATVTPVITPNGSTVTVSYTPSFAARTKHEVEIGYPMADGTPASTKWSFTIAGFTKDTIKGYVGLIKGPGDFSADMGGKSGKAGDTAMDFVAAGGTWVDIVDASFLNQAAANDEMSFAFWVQNYSVVNSSAFWAVSTTQNRGFQAHTPWSNNSVYFDTMGCCDATTQRINADINTFADYTGDASWWYKWHHFVFTKKADQKNIYIDGKLFLNGSSSSPLTPDFTRLGLGTDGTPGADFMRGLMDDFAVYAVELTEANAKSLAGGVSPKDVNSAKLIAYWDFNDKPAPAPTTTTITIVKGANGITIDWQGTAGSLQSASDLAGPWTAVTGSKPFTVQPTGARMFYRVK